MTIVAFRHRGVSDSLAGKVFRGAHFSSSRTGEAGQGDAWGLQTSQPGPFAQFEVSEKPYFCCF